MNKQELEHKLNDERIPTHMYKLDGGFPNEAFCLQKIGAKWEVYYSERGQKTGLKIFNSEAVACKYIYDLIKSAIKLTESFS